MTAVRYANDRPGLVEVLGELRSGQVRSEQLAERSVGTAQGHTEHHAMVTLAAERAMRSGWRTDRDRCGEGPLWGVPIVVNDNIHVAGMPNTAGTSALAHFVPPTDAPVVARLRKAGAFVVGKANIHELSVGVTSGESASGAVGNALDPRRMAGGGSGGAAVAVALGMYVGLGVDTCGSVRIPAALNGVCGFRPSFGRYPNEGITPLSTSRGTVGPMATTVADLAVLDSVLAGEPLHRGHPDRVPRLGVPASYRTGYCDRATLEAFEDALDLLRCAGVSVLEVADFPMEGVERDIGMPILAYEFRQALGRYLATYLPSVTVDDVYNGIRGAGVRAFFQRYMIGNPSTAVSTATYEWAFGLGRAGLLGQYRDVFRAHNLDALVFPTVPCRAPGDVTDLPPLAAPAPSANAHAAEVFTLHTAPGSLVGLPGLTLPVPTGGGLPVGLALDGPPGGDRALLALGQRLERILAPA